MAFPLSKELSEQILTATRRWEAEFASGDAQRFAECYTKDALMLPAGVPMLKGREAIAGFHKVMWEGFGARKIDLVSEEMLAADQSDAPAAINHVLHHRIYTADGTLIEKGKCMATWRQEDGTWRFSHDMFNSDGKAAPTRTLRRVPQHIARTAPHPLISAICIATGANAS